MRLEIYVGHIGKMVAAEVELKRGGATRVSSQARLKLAAPAVNTIARKMRCVENQFAAYGSIACDYVSPGSWVKSNRCVAY